MMLRISLVSYFNTKPFLDGLERQFSIDEKEVNLLSPSGCARSFANAECDLALVPVGALWELGDVTIFPGFCIGAKGNVGSVFLLSQVPFDEITRVIPDPDSRTSNILAKIIMERSWKKNPAWDEAEQLDSLPEPTTAIVAIGDRAIRIKERFKYVYDLAGEWKKFTGLPFVFAVWVSRPGALSESVREKIQKAFWDGILGIPETAKKWAVEYKMNESAALSYLQDSVKFILDDELNAGFERFLKEQKEIVIV